MANIARFLADSLLYRSSRYTTFLIPRCSERQYSKRQKLYNDPVEPKRPLTSFMSFFVSKRQDVLRTNPDLSVGDVAKHVTRLWANLHEDEKNKYVQEYTQRLKEYQKQKKEFMDNLTVEQEQEIMKRKEERKQKLISQTIKKERKLHKRPKRPITAFLRFADSIDYERGERQYTEFMKVAGEKWQKLSHAEKKVFHDLSDKEMKLFYEQLEQWEDKMIDSGLDHLVRRKVMNKLKMKDKKTESKK